jgi:hypothetical protein
MTDKEDIAKIAELINLFRRLGARDAESWATSEIKENIPQLARFLFLRSAWKCVIDENNYEWIDEEIKVSSLRPNDPCAGIGLALQRLLKRGVEKQDINDVVRVKQYELLFRLLYMIDDPGDLEPELGETRWVLDEVNKDGERTGRIVQGMYESALSMDPTGREMRPHK